MGRSVGLVEVYCWVWREVLQCLWAWLKIYLWACWEGLSVGIVGKSICGLNGNICRLGGGLFVSIFVQVCLWVCYYKYLPLALCVGLSVGLIGRPIWRRGVERPICGPSVNAFC